MIFRIVVPSRQIGKVIELKEEVKRIQFVSFVIRQFMEMVDQNNGIVGSTTRSNYYKLIPVFCF